MEQPRGRTPPPRKGRGGAGFLRAGGPPRPGFLRRAREPRVRVAAAREARPGSHRGGPRAEDPGAVVALVHEGAQPPRPPRVVPRGAMLRAGPRTEPEAEGRPRGPPEGEGTAEARGPVPRRVRVLRHVRGGGPGVRGVRDRGAVHGGDEVTLPSAAEVEHAEWPALKAFASELGLNPKGRSGLVRQRVLDHLRTQPSGPDWRAGKAEQAALLTRIGPADLAASLWESTISLDAPAPWVGLGTAYLKANRLEEAIKCSDRAIGMGDSGARLHKAHALLRVGRSDAAITEVHRALERNPGNVRAWAMRAVISEASGDSDEVLAARRKIADSGRGSLGLAKMLMRAGRFEGAVKALDLHLSNHPEDALGWNQRGVALAKRAEWRGADEALRKAAALKPRDPGILNNLAIALAGAGRIGEAGERNASAPPVSGGPPGPPDEAGPPGKAGSSATARDVYDRVLEVAPEHPEAVAGKRRVARRTKSVRKPKPGPSPRTAKAPTAAKPRSRTRKSPANTASSKSRKR